jgi:hypothetical protein
MRKHAKSERQDFHFDQFRELLSHGNSPWMSVTIWSEAKRRTILLQSSIHALVSTDEDIVNGRKVNV